MKMFIGMISKRNAHDWFRCTKCGYEAQLKVLGNHATCSECGGMMVRT